MTLPYVKRFYFNDRKLKQRALVEFSRALSTGRMVAFTGSMTTESAGYPDWPSLRLAYLEIAEGLLAEKEEKMPPPTVASAIKEARRVLDAIRRQTTQTQKDAAQKPHRVLGNPVTFSLIKEAMDSVDTAYMKLNSLGSVNDLLVAELGKRLAEGKFKRSSGSSNSRRPASAVEALVRSLGITRFVTLNYDLEIEYASMLEPGRDCLAEELVNDQPTLAARVPQRIFTTRANGKTAISDIFSRDRPDCLVEFSVSSSIDNTHILHLHGRVDNPESMILGTRDYDQLYRRTDPSKQSFQHGLRILFAGNPVLIVGIGMTEAEVNSTLQNLVSDNPYQYRAPIFLLWNTSAEAADPDVRQRNLQLARLDWLTRLGIFVIFDEDLLIYRNHIHERYRLPIIDLNSRLENLREKPRDREGELQLLTDTIHMLGISANEVRDRTREHADVFRSMKSRIANRKENQVQLWCPECSGEIAKHGEALYEDNYKKWHLDKFNSGSILAIVGPAGAGKGLLAKAISKNAFNDPSIMRFIANAGFCFDIDSLVDGIICFLRELGYGRDEDQEHRRSRESALKNFVATKGERGLIVLNGCDRFFSPDSILLSAEFDFLIRLFARADPSFEVKLVLIGTERVLSYLRQMKNIEIHELSPLLRKDDVYLGLFKNELDTVTFGLANRANIESARKAPGAGAAWRRAILRVLLDYDMLDALTGGQGRLAAIVLRTMSFIGMPVEAIVLLHGPAVRTELIREKGIAGAAEALSRVMDMLFERHVILRFQSFEGNPRDDSIWMRYGLHGSVLEALRSHYDVPLTESKRANSFNMSLYLAQPTDSDSPSPSVHAELGALIDHLLGAYKDSPLVSAEPKYKEYASKIPRELEKDGYLPLHNDAPEEVASLRLLTPETVACLRAALHIIRGYYSTAALLTIDRGDPLATGQRSGLLQEHAERLECLLRAYRKLTRFRQVYFRLKFPDKDKAKTNERQNEVAEEIGPEPYYADELVWVYNELGVVRLAQGDLYAAQVAFDMARKVNEETVEGFDRSHNWRRIMMNVIVLDMERGKLNDAERHLRALEAAINQFDAPESNSQTKAEEEVPASASADEADSEKALGRRENNTAATSHVYRSGIDRPFEQKSRLEQIVSIFGEQAGQPSLRRRLLPSKEFRHEDILIAAVISSLRGLLEHFRGHLRVARGGYLDGIRMLRHLGEQRAYAIFQRYYAVLMRSLGEREKYRQEIKIAIAAAESVRQMDIVYMSRMFRSESDNDTLAARREYLNQATVALEYATLTDMYRVQVEATGRLARAKYISGDYETAFEHATDAIAMASRYGMQLRKIELLILMGSILYRRGDKRSGFAMIDQAIVKANHIGFQRGIERAERERGRLPTPD